ncbi:MAG TPA: carboxypeptidase-like regulatory domain-containing protein [Saprospiraceae bacterium]|nr:carboxypeptidase-like regulatory domain-containing protein [Saprospiraceae bacterium]
MIKKLLAIQLLVFFGFSLSFAQTSLEGKVVDKDTKEPIMFGTVALYKGNTLVTGTETDMDGNFILSNLDPGTYDLEARYVGYTTARQTGVIVLAGRVNRLNFEIGTEGQVLDEVVITEFKAPLIEIDNTTSGGTVTSEKIKNLPSRNVNAIASTTAGLSSVNDGAVSIRGSRTDATAYYVDGIRVMGLIPESEIDQLQVITGGMEAKYGDVTGGLISITSKGPSSRFSGGVEAETSQFLDPYGYNLFNGYLSGPLIKKKNTSESILGFRLSGRYQSSIDGSPSAVGVYRLSEEKIRELEAEPMKLVGGSFIPSATFLSGEDVGDPLKARPNSNGQSLDLTGRIDAKLSNNIDFSLSGSYFNNVDRFNPDGWALLNWINNPFYYSNGYRGNFRYRHRLGAQGIRPDQTAEERAKRSSSAIRNAYYTIQVGYEKRFGRTEDVRHEDRLFEYGYLGKTDRQWVDAIDFVDTSIWKGDPIELLPGRFVDFVGYREMEGEFTPNDEINPVLARYNTVNGRLVSSSSVVWDDLYNNVGQVYNSFSKEERERYTGNVTVGLDFLPGGSNKGRHNIELGFIVEQRIERSWGISPFRLWEIARLYANDRHIFGVDTNDVVGTIDTVIFGQQLTFNRYNTNVIEDSDLKFYKAVREVTGQSVNEYVNVDGIDPSKLTLDMFSASELNDNTMLGYYGYDYLGNKVSSSTKFNDFFGTGRSTMPVAPRVPIYYAGYIQDKFSFKDIIFRLGLRVDYYDANTRVMKDPYALYEIETAKDYYARIGKDQPSSIGDEYKVYVESAESDAIVGFRKADQWYYPNGTATDGNILMAGKLVNPSYVGRADGSRILNIKDPDYDPNNSFEDYTPQFNFMPRIAFSFPISDEAGFFAHYDVTVQRPPDNSFGSPLIYYYFEDNVRSLYANPNLKPEKTVDYEVGFQQKLSNTSALKISSYYKELRDMIQRRVFPFIPTPVNQYESYDNIDFGTVKGFSFTYDYRRTGNLEFQVAYTLQFANGTGSDANSSRGINTRGNLRYLIPLSYDERHRISSIIDYRYASGKRYNGPRIAGLDILANTGVNMLVTAVSGRPYTRTSNPTAFGGSGFLGAINGARLPWYFNMDLKIDKDISIRDKAFVNVYFRIQNILDIKNVIGVYSYSGTPEDSGYLLSSYGADRLAVIESTGRPVENFLEMYQWRLLAPGFYSYPRRIYLGATVSF